ncbi:uncharacterized protein itprid1 [Centroberyx gerrardi]
MASEGAAEKRANLVASRVHWSNVELLEPAQDGEAHEPLRRNPSSEDDLALGVEASLYGKQGVKTVQEFLRWTRSSPALTRWNSFSSAASAHSGPLSVMDVLNLWNDDPEEVLLDLGFGCDEPDISGRIPARFINHQSQARGISLQVFLEAQKNRLDLENPDVSNRFRQLEVLQQVTTAFSSLVGASSSPSSPGAPMLPAEARERRRRMGMLFRRASKKSLSQTHNQNTQDPTTQAATYPSAAPQPSQPLTSLGDKKTPVKRVKPGLQETICLSPLAEEQGPGPDTQPQPQVAFFVAQEGALRPGPLKEGHPLTPPTAIQRKRSPGQARESFEMEEIHSFDDSSITGSYTGGADTVWGVMRTNSCQSDSSGFLEEPFIPSLPQQASPGPELIKALSCLSGGSTDSQITVREPSSAPHSPTSPSPLPSSSLTLSGIETSVSPTSLCLPKSDSPLESPEKEPSPEQDLLQPPTNSPASSALVFDSPPPHSSSPELEDMVHSQSSTLPSPASFNSPSPTSSSHLTSPSSSGSIYLPQPALLYGGPEEMQTEEDAPRLSLSTFSPELEGKTDSPFPTTPPLTSLPSHSPSPASHCPPSFASIATSVPQTDSPIGSPENTQTEGSEASPHPSLSALCPELDDKASFPSPTLPPPTSPPSPSPDFHCPPCFHSPLGSPEDTQTEMSEVSPLSSLFPDSDGVGLSHPHIETQMEEEATPLLTSLSLSSHLHEEDPSPPSTLPSASFKFEEDLPKLSCLSPTSPSLICQHSVLSSLPSTSPGPDGLTDPVVGRIPDLTEQSVTQQDGSRHHDHNTDSAPESPVQNVIKAKMDDLALGSEDNLQRDGRREGEGERHNDTVQTQETVVYSSDTDCSVVLSVDSRSVSEAAHYETETEPQVHSCGLHDEFPAETKEEESRKVAQAGIDETESEPQKSYFVSHDEGPETNSTTELEPKVSGGPIEIESLDLVFETSVDGSEGDGEYGDVDAICRELDSDGHVYWAEPIEVSTPSPVLEESGSFDTPSSTTLDSAPASSTNAAFFMSQSASSDTHPSLTPAPSSSSPTLVDLNGLGRLRSSRSVSVQMPSSPSSHSVSHIVHRKDVPCITDSKPTLLPSVLALDTSTPLRAIQSWTDQKIQQNALTKKMPYRGLHTLPNQVTISTGASEMTQRPAVIFSSSPSFPLLSSDWQSRDSLPGSVGSFRSKSVSLDTGLWPDEDEEVDRGEDEDEERLWEGNLMTNMACCCSCDHQCTCCTQNSHNKQHTVGNFPYSLDELEGMMLCLRRFRSVLSNMEEQLSEDQASVYNALSDHDREEVRDIAELRRAVKQEAGELELQLNELAHHYDDSFKMKMHRLLDEQSLLCSQLRLLPPGATPTSSTSRTVATQCCLLPWLPLGDVPSDRLPSRGTWDLESSRHSLPGSEAVCEGLGCSPTKADKLDFVGFLQRLKESLRHSVNTDSLE